VIAFREGRLLADGRIGALVDTRFPSESLDIQTDYFVFTLTDERWLIDSITEGLEAIFPPTT